MQITPEPEENAEVNITAGTKSQTAFLSLFAKMHDATVWSIDNKTNRLSRIPYNKTRPLIFPSIETLLHFKCTTNFKLKDFKNKDSRTYAALKEYLCFIKDTKDFNKFPPRGGVF